MDKQKEFDFKYLIYLDTLRESGITNMYGAAPYLVNAYPKLTMKEGRQILSYWMKTFSERHKGVSK